MTYLFMICAVGFVFFTAILMRGCFEMISLPWLSKVVPQPGPDLPSVSVVIPACNEEDSLQAAMESLLASEGVDLQVILVDDRSTDGTSAIADNLAAGDGRLSVIHVEDLPSRWLGKVHAMHLGAERATGDFLLFADADVRYGPMCLARAVTWADMERADHLSLMPLVDGGSLLAEAAMNVFGAGFMAIFRPSRVNRDVPDAYIGVGAFNMVRREAFEATEGWPWLRLEVADDVGLGLLMRRHGARSRFALATDDLKIQWYSSVGEMKRGLAKNAFLAGAGGSVPLALLCAAMCCGPLVCLGVLLASPWAWYVGGASLLIMVGVGAGSVSVGSRAIPGALTPLVSPILGWFVLNSAWLCTRSKGITWRGTTYSLVELEEGRRVDLQRPGLRAASVDEASR